MRTNRSLYTTLTKSRQMVQRKGICSTLVSGQGGGGAITPKDQLGLSSEMAATDSLTPDYLIALVEPVPADKRVCKSGLAG
jgi:hypothetical protein